MFQTCKTTGINAAPARKVAGGRRRRAVRVQAVNVDALRSAKKECEELIKRANCAPIMVRTGWHDAGTYNVADGTGGATGTLRFDVEINAAPNAGLSLALKLLNKTKKDHPEVSWADLMQMAGATAIEVAGGPKIDMLYGRKDAEEHECGDTTGLPAGNSPFPQDDTAAGHLRTVFYRMGFNDQEIVALSGAHTLGRAFKQRSGIPKVDETKYTKDGPGTKGGQSWTEEWLQFDNSYFKEVKEKMNPDLLVMETDDVIFKDPGFAPYANKYHDDNDAFMADYAAAHKKLSELGVTWDEGGPVSIQASLWFRSRASSCWSYIG
eukprot:TRINITY_DN3594_c0_g3_i2.p1 TRINITY_DN3594_c0_g3~~TRINITY_DN3594_c0_g3_i2.p1  ORF type:complete len:322 (+),score=50.27 TRINITY_DN3594_c0_g3_i2:109-1074(+)